MLSAGEHRSGAHLDLPRNELIGWCSVASQQRASSRKGRNEKYSSLQKKQIVKQAWDAASPEEQATAVSLILGAGVVGRFEPAVGWAEAHLAALAAIAARLMSATPLSAARPL